MKNLKPLSYTLLTLILFLTACSKLDEKPKQSLVVPTTLQDMQGLMDNSDILNTSYGTLGEISSDNYYLNQSNYNSLSVIQHKNAYVWGKDIFGGVTFEADWNYNYQKVFYCNLALEGIDKLFPTANTMATVNDVKGQALFHRANSFFMICQEFANVYDEKTSTTDLGIPLRFSSDLNIPSVRGTLQETYDQILRDLLLAKTLLPKTVVYKTRPSKSAAYGLLSRVYLSKADYNNAYLYADSALQSYNTLINYNTLSISTPYPFIIFNSEVIFHGTLGNIAVLSPTRAIIDDNLYTSYSTNDMRKNLFFISNGNGTYAFKGNYNGSANPLFGGIATDELYLTRAECLARAGQTTQALADLNTLLLTRFKTGTFLPINATSADDALAKILTERRKELILRGLRWSDLRRLNKDQRFAITLKRTVGNDVYTLPPNDSRYTLPIPDYIIALNGIPQNPR